MSSLFYLIDMKNEKKPVAVIDRQVAENLMDFLYESEGNLSSPSITLFWQMMKSNKITLQSLFLVTGWTNHSHTEAVDVRLYNEVGYKEEYNLNSGLASIRTLNDFFSIKRVVLFYSLRGESRNVRIDHTCLPYGVGKHPGLKWDKYSSNRLPRFYVLNSVLSYGKFSQKVVDIDFSKLYFRHDIYIGENVEYRSTAAWYQEDIDFYKVKANEYADVLDVDTCGANLELTVHSAQRLSIRNSKSVVLNTNPKGFIFDLHFSGRTDVMYNGNDKYDYPILYVPNGELNCVNFTTRFMYKGENDNYNSGNRPTILIGKIDESSDYNGLYQHEYWERTQKRAVRLEPYTPLQPANKGDVLVENYYAIIVKSDLYIGSKEGVKFVFNADFPHHHYTTVNFDGRTDGIYNEIHHKPGVTENDIDLLFNQLTLTVKGNDYDYVHMTLTNKFHNQAELPDDLVDKSVMPWTCLDFELDKMLNTEFILRNESTVEVEDHQALIEYVKKKGGTGKKRAYHCFYKSKS